MDEALPLSPEYLDFEIKKAKTGSGIKYLSSGSYYMSEAFDLKGYLSSGSVRFTSPANTSFCLDTLSYSDVQASFEYLQLLGVTTHTSSCEETIDLNKHDDCAYYSLLGNMPIAQAKLALSQSAVNTYIQMVKDGGALINQSALVYLTENVRYDGMLEIGPDCFVVVCKNGFSFEGKVPSNVLVVDCTDHSCFMDNFASYFPISQEFLTFYTTAFASMAESLVLPSGKYALMGDVDFTGLNLTLSETGEYSVCLNGYNVKGLEAAPNLKVSDCT
jgi:hypothetical protein